MYLKRFKQNRSFSLIEIIVTLGFTGVILTTFIALSAYALNLSKDNEVEDVASQTLLELSDVMKSPSSVFVDFNGNSSNVDGKKFTLSKTTQGKRNILKEVITQFDVDFSLENCRNISELQYIYYNSQSTTNTDYLICAFVEIDTLANDSNLYYFKVTVLAEKSNNRSFKETLEGIRLGRFDTY